MSINDNIQLRIQQVLGGQAVVKTSAPAKKQSSFLTTFLGVCIVCLSFVTAFAVWKKPLNLEAEAVAVTQKPTQVVHETMDLKHVGNQLLGHLKEQEQLSKEQSHADHERLVKLEKEVQGWALRCWMLGVLQNENTYLTQQTLGRKPGYIYFDQNWKLNRMPSGYFDERQRAKMEQQVRRTSK